MRPGNVRGLSVTELHLVKFLVYAPTLSDKLLVFPALDYLALADNQDPVSVLNC